MQGGAHHPHDALRRRRLDASYPQRLTAARRLYRHQHDAAQVRGHLLLRAPTGRGKTEAALLWAHRQVTDLAVTRGGTPRVFYTLPYLASISAMTQRLGEELNDPHLERIGVVHSRAACFHLERALNDDCDHPPTDTDIRRHLGQPPADYGHRRRRGRQRSQPLALGRGRVMQVEERSAARNWPRPTGCTTHSPQYKMLYRPACPRPPSAASLPDDSAQPDSTTSTSPPPGLTNSLPKIAATSTKPETNNSEHIESQRRTSSTLRPAAADHLISYRPSEYQPMGMWRLNLQKERMGCHDRSSRESTPDGPN
ncbi:hypothetical protein [Allonocardiopsis opalescens]|uniref:hypothetical protein n=1 Tax=Allonocardiopsis opalescens TaxID=1144618 RepID=UPI0011B277E6|nr:hypothetical protein [Allonocardiopsis opalescens]